MTIKSLIRNWVILLSTAVLIGCGAMSQAQAQSSDTTMVGAGDIANCSHVNDEATAKLIDANPNARVFTLGDNVYPDGSPQQFADCYNPTWGRFKDRTYPSVGNHDYHTSGASGYSNYFDATKVGPVGRLYYSYNYGGWHVIVLDSEASMTDTSLQMDWLREDLIENPSQCTMAMFHHPRWSTGNHGNSNRPIAAWQIMYDRGVDLVLNGHDHTYERFRPQTPNGQADSTGIRQFVVGTGGAGLYPFTSTNPNTEIRQNNTFGVLKLTLTSTNYSWEFIPVAGKTFTDSGSYDCLNNRGSGPNITNTPVTSTVTNTPTKTPVVSKTATVSRTPSPTRTIRPTRTATLTRTPTKTKLPTKTATLTRTPTKTRTPSKTPTVTRTPTVTLTPTFTATSSPTETLIVAADTETPTPTITVTPTETETPTETPIVPTQQEIVFQPSSLDIKNPERGFMKQSSIYPDQTFDPNKIRALQPTDSLVWVYFRLDGYIDRPLDAAGLNNIIRVFTEARNKGLKIVVRFNYNGGVGSTPDPAQAIPDATIEIVRQHLTQLTPIIQANTDVIAVVQVGFVGHWGEWHSSKNLHPIEFRKEIVDTLLDIVPTSRMLMLRYPRYHSIFFSSPVTQSEAFTGTNRSRVGIHDDCFMCDSNDGGTYTSTTGQLPKHTSNYCDSAQDKISCWKQYTNQQTTYSPFGGEASKVNAPRTDCISAIPEMERVHPSFLNNGFNTQVLGIWTSQGCMDDIRLRLGYRFVLKTAVIPSTSSAGSPLTVNIRMANEGFASMYNPRSIYLVLLGQNVRYNLPVMGVNLRLLLGGTEQTYNMTVNVPENVPAGTYRLGLWMPDMYISLTNNPAYAVRTGNTDTWDATTGINILGQIEVR